MTIFGPPRWAHQLRELERSKDAVAWALFMEMRTGKTPVLIDTAAHLYDSGKITGWIHIAPNGVHADFAREYLATYAGFPQVCHVWRASRANQTAVIAERNALLNLKSKLAIISINVDAIRTKTFRQYAGKFLKKHRALASLDESLDISAWSKRTKVAIEVGKRAAYRRILDGTPADAKPLGLYYQFQFLGRGLLGFTSFGAFKLRYAVTEDRCMAIGMRNHVVDPETGVCPHCHHKAAEFAAIVGYRNIEELRAKLQPLSSRVLREHVTDMPPKVYERRTFEMTKEQRRIYDDIAEEGRAELEGVEVDARHVLARIVRLQQVASGFLPGDAAMLPCPDCIPPFDECLRCGGYGFIAGPRQIISPIGKTNPRILALDAAVSQLREQDQVVIWSRFRFDRDAIAAWAAKRGEHAVRYDGEVDLKTRQAGYDAFRKGAARYFSGDPVAAGRGRDLSSASCVIYYSQGWSLRFRRQSEDRTQSLAKRDPTLYIDLVGADTVDEKIIAALRAGRDLAADVMGDPKGGWI